jgi:hypothetical protein
MQEFTSLTASEKADLFAYLKRDPARHALVLQNLTTWPDASKFYFTKLGDVLSYLHISGHPSSAGGPTVLVLDGAPAPVEALLNAVQPTEPIIVRETSAHLEGAVRGYFSSASFKLEHRMDVDRASFKPHHRGKARPLEDKDAPALCSFMGAPPQAAPRFMGWLKGARVFYGVEEGGELN